MKYLILFSNLAIIITLPSCSGKCTYKKFAEIPNANSNYRVVKFYNWCGLTSSNNNNFSLLRSADSIEDRQRIIFVVNSTVGENLDQDTTVKITWISDSSLQITYDRTLNVLEKKSSLDNIVIKYSFK